MSVRDDGPSTGAGSGPRPFGAVVASAIEGFRTLARQQAELVKIEMAEAAAVRGQGAGMMAGAGVVAAYAVGFLAAAAAAGLAVILPVWAAILIVGVLLLGVAGILVAIGRRVLKTAPPVAERTKALLQEDAAWAKQQITR